MSYRNDTDALVARVDALQRENHQLRAENERLRGTIAPVEMIALRTAATARSEPISGPEQRREEAWREYHAHWSLPPPPPATRPVENRWGLFRDPVDVLAALLITLPIAFGVVIILVVLAEIT